MLLPASLQLRNSMEHWFGLPNFISTRHRHFTPQLGLWIVAAMSALRDLKAIDWPAEQEYKGHSVGGLLKYLIYGLQSPKSSIL